MFIIGFFKLASLGIDIGEPLKGTVRSRHFPVTRKAAWAGFSFCAVKSLMGEPSLGPLPSCPLFEGLSYWRWRHTSLRVMEATAKAD